jgi:DNA modification methylase
VKFAYADPPYLGQGAKHYGKHHPEARIWDSVDAHRELIDRLVDEYPDGWALSASSPSLRALLPLCPEDVRIAAWVKPFCIFKKGVRPAYAWEPVIFRGGRNKNHPPPEKGGKQTTPKDYLACNITLKKGLTGAKPEAFCEWVLDLLNVQVGDVIDDVFPGTGGFSVATETRLSA